MAWFVIVQRADGPFVRGTLVSAQETINPTGEYDPANGVFWLMNVTDATVEDLRPYLGTWVYEVTPTIQGQPSNGRVRWDTNTVAASGKYSFTPEVLNEIIADVNLQYGDGETEILSVSLANAAARNAVFEYRIQPFDRALFDEAIEYTQRVFQTYVLEQRRWICTPETIVTLESGTGIIETVLADLETLIVDQITS